MTLSKYNFYLDVGERCLVYNAASGNCIVLPSSKFQSFKSVDCPEEDMKQYLLLGFYVKDEDNEVQCLLDRSEQYKKHHMKKKYRVLTTTCCNASCPYCYEIGAKAATMDNTTAKAVADFILNQSNDAKEIEIEWFGGEPLLNTGAIDFICSEILRRKPSQLTFKSSIITNGSLITEEMVSKMVDDWKVYKVQITLDGCAEEYERVKGLGPGSFEKVIKNIGLVSSKGIKTNIRLNFDKANLGEMKRLIEYLAGMPFKDQIRVYAAPINHGCAGNLSGLESDTKEMYGVLHACGFMTQLQLLPRTMKTPCSASFSGYYMINANGLLFKCDRKLVEENSVGNVFDQTINFAKCSCEWENLPLPDRCLECKLLPLCWGGCTYERKNGQGQCHITEEIVYSCLQLVMSDYLDYISIS